MHPPSHFQIPAIIIASSAEGDAICPEAQFNGLEHLFRSIPTFAPDSYRARPRQRETRRAMPPRGKAALQATPQACQWLEEVQDCYQTTQLQPGDARSRWSHEGGASCTQDSLSNGHTNHQSEQGQCEEQRSPKAAE